MNRYIVYLKRVEGGDHSIIVEAHEATNQGLYPILVFERYVDPAVGGQKTVVAMFNWANIAGYRIVDAPDTLQQLHEVWPPSVVSK
jgi:hypothetical protein